MCVTMQLLLPKLTTSTSSSYLPDIREVGSRSKMGISPGNYGCVLDGLWYMLHFVFPLECLSVLSLEQAEKSECSSKGKEHSGQI